MVTLQNLQSFVVYTSGGKYDVKAGGKASAIAYIRETYPQYVVIQCNNEAEEIEQSLSKGFE